MALGAEERGHVRVLAQGAQDLPLAEGDPLGHLHRRRAHEKEAAADADLSFRGGAQESGAAGRGGGARRIEPDPEGLGLGRPLARVGGPGEGDQREEEGEGPGHAESLAGQHAKGPLQEAAELGQERGADRAVDHAVVAGERHREPLARRPLRRRSRRGSSRTWPTARMAPSGGLMTAANVVDAEHPEVRDGEGPVRHLLGLELLRPARAPRARAPRAAMADDALLVGVAHDRRHQAVGDGDGDRDVDAPVHEDGLGRELRVALGHADERDGAGLDEQIVERHLERLRRPRRRSRVARPSRARR